MKMRLLKISALILAFLAVSLMALIPAGNLRADGESTIKAGDTKSVDLKSEHTWWYKYRDNKGKMLELKSTGSTIVTASVYDGEKKESLIFSNRDENGNTGNVRLAWYFDADTDYYIKVRTMTDETPVSPDNDTKITLKDITDNTVVAKIDEENFPDPIFRGIVSNYDFRHDGKLYKDVVNEIQTIKNLSSSIASFKGIEYFTELRLLECIYYTGLRELDLSKNTKLQSLRCDLCENITSINVSNCKDLTNLQCIYTAVTSLDLKDCKDLSNLTCYGSRLKSLDLSGKSNLVTVQCYNNNLKSLNVKGCTNLQTLECSNNKDLESLDVSDCLFLNKLTCDGCKISDLKLSGRISELNCSSNALKVLELSGCSMLRKLICHDNELEELDISDCPWIQAVYVKKFWKDDPGQYSGRIENKDCIFRFDSGLPISGKTNTTDKVVEINATNFPDANFRAVIKGYDIDGDDWLSSSEIKLISDLSVYYKQVENLEGIKYLTELVSFNCNDNKIKTLDLSANKKLETLNCSENEIPKITLPKDSKLQSINCSKNNLKSLDLSGCKDLMYLDCSENKLTAIDLSKNTNLRYLMAYVNQITSLNIGSNKDLGLLAIFGNKIKEIDISDSKVLIRQYKEGDKREYKGDVPYFWYATQFNGYLGLVVDPDMKIITEKIISLTLDKKEANIVCGSTLTLKATLKNSTSAISWKSSDTKIATVDSKGKITSKMAGKVTITASAAGKTAKCTVTVFYKDVTNSSDFWYAPTNYLTAKGVVKGYANQTEFRPANECTRAQMVTFLYRLQGEPATKSNKCKFDDVKDTDYFYKPVIWATEKGITTGVSAKEFAPQKVCTRAQTVTFLWRMAGKPAPGKNAKKFTDVEEKAYYYKATLWASDMKILAGYDDGTFKPEGKCLRRQMVTFLYKYDKYVNGKG